MDVSAETADLLVREGVQVTEGVIKLTGVALKNITAFLIAISQQNYKVVGQTSVKRLAKDAAPAEIVHLKKEDIPKFQKLAKQYGVLYFLVHKKGNEYGMTNVISTVNYAPQLNAIMEELGYPIPEKAPEEQTVKKATPRTPQGRSSPERENGLKQRAGSSDEKPSVKGRLQALKEAAGNIEPKIPTREKSL